MESLRCVITLEIYSERFTKILLIRD